MHLVFSFIAVTSCVAGRQQPYLLFGVLMSDRYDVGMLSTHDRHFSYVARSSDRSDLVTMDAKLLERTTKGFRFTWSVVHSSKGKVVSRVRKQILVPWSADSRAAKVLDSVPGYHATAFYSPVRARQGPPVIVE
jgi:hypothetical protein